MTQETLVDSAPSRRSVRLIALLVGLALLVLLVDQGTKTAVVSTMYEGQRIVVIPNILQLIFVRNPGAAFSMASGQTWIFSILAVVVTGVIIAVIRKIKSRAWAVVFGLILGGTLGNLADRLFREPGFAVGHVIDFINMPWLMPAIFNVADIAISAAAVMFVLLILLGVGLDGKRQRKTTTPKEAPDGDA